MKMLIVDDSKAMRNYLQSIATELSFQTEAAEDGREGLSKLIHNDPRDPFAVALVDWEMPVMNGLELVRTVRRNQDFNALKLMMVTTRNTPEQVVLALEAGADDYLMKPVTRELLEEKLQILGMV
jgi:two-component system chemotaxis response regulator CheY